MDNRINIKVTPSYDFLTNELQIRTETQCGDMAANYAAKVMNLEEEAVKTTLIKLGWTPPSPELDFDTWWEKEGEIKWIEEPIEAKELCRIAWENGEYCAKRP